MSDRVHKVKADIEKNLWKFFSGIVDVGYSMPKEQVVKLIFIAPC